MKSKLIKIILFVLIFFFFSIFLIQIYLSDFSNALIIKHEFGHTFIDDCPKKFCLMHHGKNRFEVILTLPFKIINGFKFCPNCRGKVEKKLGEWKIEEIKGLLICDEKTYNCNRFGKIVNILKRELEKENLKTSFTFDIYKIPAIDSEKLKKGEYGEIDPDQLIQYLSKKIDLSLYSYRKEKYSSIEILEKSILHRSIIAQVLRPNKFPWQMKGRGKMGYAARGKNENEYWEIQYAFSPLGAISLFK